MTTEKNTNESIVDTYARQMAEAHAFLVEKNFWMVVKEKPRWMPGFLYRAVIKELIEFQEHRGVIENVK